MDSSEHFRTSFYRAHRKYDPKVIFSEFMSFCSQVGGGLGREGSLVLTLTSRCANRGGGEGGRGGPWDIATTAVRGTQLRLELPPCLSDVLMSLTDFGYYFKASD